MLFLLLTVNIKNRNLNLHSETPSKEEKVKFS